MDHLIEQRISTMTKTSKLHEINSTNELREKLKQCSFENNDDSMQCIKMYIYDLTTYTDIYVVEYDDEIEVLVGIVNPLRMRNSIKVKAYPLNKLGPNHKVFYKYYDDSLSLEDAFLNLRSNENYLIENKKL